jgi:hypothetical protein
MYDNYTRFYDGYLSRAQDVPQNDSEAGNGDPIDLTRTQTSNEILAIANTDVVIAAGKNFTIKIQDCATALGTFTDLETIYSLASPASETTLTAGTVLGTYVPPNESAKPFIRSYLTTTDAAATGKVDVFPHYIAR